MSSVRSSTSRAQSEVLSVALLLGIVVAGTTAVVIIGGAAVADTERSSQLKNAEHAMTLLDSRTAMVALGGSQVQTVEFGQSGGDYTVRESSGTLEVVHVDYDGSGVDQTLYTGSLGAVVYENDGTEIAYQGGGVWRKSGDSSTMISPPEFHYRGATLTLPVVNVTGSDGGSGSVVATMREPETGAFARQYPNATTTYPDSREYVNPVQKGYIRIEVQSEYYGAWAEYFRTRTDGQVTVYDNNETARLELITIGTIGGFTMQNVGQTIPIRGFPTNGHSLNAFEITLRPENKQNSRFNNLMWSMSSTSPDGSEHLELAVNANGAKCGDSVTAALYYTDDGGSTYEGWTAPFTIQCPSGDPVVTVDFMSASKTATYGSLSGRDGKLYSDGFKGNKGSLADPGTLAADANHSAISVSPGSTRSIGFVTGHYFSEFGSNIPLTINEGNNAGQCYAGSSCTASTGYIDYPGSNRVVTYLHITENRVEVRFD